MPHNTKQGGTEDQTMRTEGWLLYGGRWVKEREVRGIINVSLEARVDACRQPQQVGGGLIAAVIVVPRASEM